MHILEWDCPKSLERSFYLNDRRNYYGPRPMRPVQPPTPVPEPGVTALPEDPVVAMAYVPMQTDTKMYDESKALSEGTLFPALNKPFAGAGDRR